MSEKAERVIPTSEGDSNRKSNEFHLLDLLELDTSLQSHIFSFCHEAILILFLEASLVGRSSCLAESIPESVPTTSPGDSPGFAPQDSFLPAVTKALSLRSSVHLSFLHQLYPNSIQALATKATPSNKISRQELSVCRLLNLILGDGEDEHGTENHRVDRRSSPHGECGNVERLQAAYTVSGNSEEHDHNPHKRQRLEGVHTELAQDSQTIATHLSTTTNNMTCYSADFRCKLRYLEILHLRGISGKGWLPRLARAPLRTLDLSGCAGLDPSLLIDYLVARASTYNSCRTPIAREESCLKSLNLSGCVRVGPRVVAAIANHQHQLEALWLGGCSQSIKSSDIIHCLLPRLVNLRHLDLQDLHNLSDLSGQFMQVLPVTIESINFSSCKFLRLAGIEALEAIQVHMNHQLLGRGEQRDNDDNDVDSSPWASAPRNRHSKMIHLVLDAIGTPRIGLCRGVLAYFSMGRSLREVHITGCEQVQDWEVEALAVLCADTLTCFQARGCRIGDPAILALAKYCKVLAEVDVSACFRVGNRGIVALSSKHLLDHGPQDVARSQLIIPGGLESRLRVLRLASLPGLTNVGVVAIANIKSLHILDVENCIEVTSNVLCNTILQLPYLVDINAKGIADSCASLTSLLRQAAISVPLPTGLRFVNQRVFRSHSRTSTLPPDTEASDSAITAPLCPNSTLAKCCSVRTKSQRLGPNTPMAPMYHCIDCNLVPKFDRGICSACISSCHVGHRTFLGAWDRFYCDCPFQVAAHNPCRALFLETNAIPLEEG